MLSLLTLGLGLFFSGDPELKLDPLESDFDGDEEFEETELCVPRGLGFEGLLDEVLDLDGLCSLSLCDLTLFSGLEDELLLLFGVG